MSEDEVSFNFDLDRMDKMLNTEFHRMPDHLETTEEILEWLLSDPYEYTNKIFIESRHSKLLNCYVHDACIILPDLTKRKLYTLDDYDVLKRIVDKKNLERS